MVDDMELWTVTDLDRAHGYDTARAIPKFSGDILGGVATGGLGCWSKGRTLLLSIEVTQTVNGTHGKTLRIRNIIYRCEYLYFLLHFRHKYREFCFTGRF